MSLFNFYLIFILVLICTNRYFFLRLNKDYSFWCQTLSLLPACMILGDIFLTSVHFLSSVFKKGPWKCLSDRVVKRMKWHSTCTHLSPVSDWHIVKPQILAMLVERLAFIIPLAFSFLLVAFQSLKSDMK